MRQLLLCVLVFMTGYHSQYCPAAAANSINMLLGQSLEGGMRRTSPNLPNSYCKQVLSLFVLFLGPSAPLPFLAM
jgi:hypothetical protein